MQEHPSLTEIEHRFPKYLAAKVQIDDRALNRNVWERLQRELSDRTEAPPLRVLEVGCGTGTMLERFMSWGLGGHITYTGVDAQARNIAEAQERLPRWGGELGHRVVHHGNGSFTLERNEQQVRIKLEASDAFDFAARHTHKEHWDLLVAHAFLDLVDIPSSLPRLFALLHHGGLFYFTLNFDGVSIFEPQIDPELDKLVLSLYHRSMDERLAGGRVSGDSQAGRHLFEHLRAAGAQILEAGPSDWVVYPRQGSYTPDEAYFLHFIIHTIHAQLAQHPELDPTRFADWISQRHAQIQHGELVYIAHQLDFVGRMSRQSIGK